jgi:hypothetical protein
MPQKILHETDKIQMFIDESVPCFVGVWNGFIPSKEFHENMLKKVELLKEHCPKYPKLHSLVDARTMGVISRNDLQWATEEINPLLLDAGVKYEAFVISKDAFGQIAVNRYVTQTLKQGSFHVQIFDDMESAKQWLKSV